MESFCKTVNVRTLLGKIISLYLFIEEKNGEVIGTYSYNGRNYTFKPKSKVTDPSSASEAEWSIVKSTT